jgi:hypothetical protein
MPCPFANALGEPGKGVHAARIFGLSQNDILMTIAVAALTAYVYNINFFLSLAAWFVSGEVLHWLFGTNTAFLRMIGLTPKCS